MVEELLEGEAIEEPAPEAEVEGTATRRLPALRAPAGISPWKGEVRTAAIAAGAGMVAGAATVAAVRATRGAGLRRRSGRRLLGRREPAQRVVASRSFLVDVHVLGNK
ncbi:MAG TPA: hypothetical protein VK919_13205 [Solirubrobacterales bacterium]|nr:hypothetical protein [Solirubrobacterales bacterium]